MENSKEQRSPGLKELGSQSLHKRSRVAEQLAEIYQGRKVSGDILTKLVKERYDSRIFKK